MYAREIKDITKERKTSVLATEPYRLQRKKWKKDTPTPTPQKKKKKKIKNKPITKIPPKKSKSKKAHNLLQYMETDLPQRSEKEVGGKKTKKQQPRAENPHHI